jgi:hypothetical protein
MSVTLETPNKSEAEVFFEDARRMETTDVCS